MKRFVLFWMTAGVLEWLFVELLADHFALALAIHLVASALIFFAFPREKGWWHSERLWSPFCPLLLLFPFFGWLGIGILYFMVRPLADKEMPADVESAAGPSADLRWTSPVGWLSRRERIVQELDFVPLADILAGRDIDWKRGAIERLAALKTPEAIDLLLAHRSDPSLDVRFFATASLARIKKEFDEQLDAAKRQMKKDTYKISARVFLARIYLQYARFHLLDENTMRAFEQEALYHLDYCIRSPNPTHAAFKILIDIYTGHEEWDMALKTAEKWEQSGKADVQELAQVRVQILYRMGRYGDVRSALVQMRRLKIADPRWNVIADWWGAYGS